MIDIVISFDDTGSMSSVRKAVRQRIKEVVDFLFSAFTDVRVAIAIHNDYCDRDLLQMSNFMIDKDEIFRFIERGSSYGGGDAKEAYAYVLNAVKKLPWKADASKITIVIGDERPHEKGDRSAGIVEQFDWKEECDELAAAGIRIYPIQALGNSHANFFYEGMARRTNGIKLDLSQFSQINEFLMAIGHHEAGTLDTYQTSRPEFNTNFAFKNMFNKLRGITDVTFEREVGAKLEMLSKYQVLEVKDKIKIEDFVTIMGLRFRRGRGMYQFTKSEEIQPDKEVLFVDKATGETIMDTRWCREQIGVPYGSRGTKSPKTISKDVSRKYDIFIQSNSYTRLLEPGTKFLYELDKH